MEVQSHTKGEYHPSLLGRPVILNIRQQGASVTKFTVTLSAFQYPKFIAMTLILNALGLYFNLHRQRIEILLVLLFFCLVLFLLKALFKVKEESILVVASVGVQIATTFLSGIKTTRFIDMSQVQDVVINEAISMHRTIFYLAVLLQDAGSPAKTSSLLPLFQGTRPRLSCLVKVYRGIQRILSPSEVTSDEQMSEDKLHQCPNTQDKANTLASDYSTRSKARLGSVSLHES